MAALSLNTQIFAGFPLAQKTADFELDHFHGLQMSYSNNMYNELYTGVERLGVKKYITI